MLNKIFHESKKFALLAVKDAYVEISENNEFMHRLAGNTWLLTKIPMDIDTGWKDWIGSLRYKSLTASNLIMIDSETTSNPEVLDGQHLNLENKVSYLFYMLQLSGVLEYSEANIIVGSFYDGKFDLRRMSKLPKFFFTRGYIPQPVKINSLESAVGLQKGFEQIESDKDAFTKVKRGLRTLMDGLKEKNGEDRIHEFVRSLEALILPEIGRTKRQFVHRCQTFAKASARSKKILEEAFELRSMTEHLNSWEKALESYPSAEREEIALLRTRQIENLACFSFARLLESESIRHYFSSEQEMEGFWALADDRRRQLWGNQADLEMII